MADETPASPTVEDRAAKLLGGQDPANMSDATTSESAVAPAEITPTTLASSSLPGSTPPEAGATVPTDAPVAGGEIQAATPWYARAAELGLSGIEAETEEAAQQRILDAVRVSRQREAELGAELERSRYLAAIGQAHLNPQQPVNNPPAVEPAKPFLGLPKFDAALLHRYREERVDPVTNEKKVVWKDDTPTQVRAQGEAYMADIAQYHDELLYRPHEFYERLRNELKQEIRQEFDSWQGETEGERSQQQAIDQILESAPWLWESDPFNPGQPATDFAGNRRYSAKGQAVMSIVNQLEAGGLKDVGLQWKIANQLFESQQRPATPAVAAPVLPAATPQQVRAEKQRKHQNTAMPRVAAVTQPNGVPKNKAIVGGANLARHMGWDQ